MRYAILILLVLCACSTRSIIITPDGINATSTTMLYCPEATVTRVQDGNRTVDMMGETSGVGAAVQSLGHDAVEVLRP
jgi:hypothetical protein